MELVWLSGSICSRRIFLDPASPHRNCSCTHIAGIALYNQYRGASHGWTLIIVAKLICIRRRLCDYICTAGTRVKPPGT